MKSGGGLGGLLHEKENNHCCTVQGGQWCQNQSSKNDINVREATGNWHVKQLIMTRVSADTKTGKVAYITRTMPLSLFIWKPFFTERLKRKLCQSMYTHTHTPAYTLCYVASGPNIWHFQWDVMNIKAHICTDNLVRVPVLQEQRSSRNTGCHHILNPNWAH